LQNKTWTFCLFVNNRRLPTLNGNHNRWSTKHECFSNIFTPFSITVTLAFLKSRITYDVHPLTVTAKQRTFALEIQPGPKWQDEWIIHVWSCEECKYNSELPSLEQDITSANKHSTIQYVRNFNKIPRLENINRKLLDLINNTTIFCSAFSWDYVLNIAACILNRHSPSCYSHYKYTVYTMLSDM
jgi:hypothetical protein